MVMFNTYNGYSLFLSAEALWNLAGDGSTLPTPCTVSVPKQGRCKDLIQAISSACLLKSGEKILLAEIRDHLIHRFLEDPLLLLSTIKDDDHLAAYKLPKTSKDMIYLQLIHRCEEREFSNINSSVVWKSFGTPLVTSVSRDDVITRGDIQAVVHKMLSPMLRCEKLPPSSLKQVSACKETRTSEASLGSAVNDSSVEEGQTSKSEVTSKLPLHLIDENNAYVDLSTGEDKAVRLPSLTSMRVFIDWSQEYLNNSDAHLLENLPEVLKYGPAPKKARSEPLSLYACLEAFLREEPLVPEDMWYCPRCKEQRQASKKLDLWRLPEVLVIHLKRFSYSRSNKHKLETFVNFPIHDFDLTIYVANKNSSQRQLYELYALSNHYGSMASGHYTAHIKHPEENRWYNFDDSHISPINEEDVKSAAAYVLFYRRVKGEDASVSNGALSSVDHNDNLRPI